MMIGVAQVMGRHPTFNSIFSMLEGSSGAPVLIPLASRTSHWPGPAEAVPFGVSLWDVLIEENFAKAGSNDHICQRLNVTLNQPQVTGVLHQDLKIRRIPIRIEFMGDKLLCVLSAVADGLPGVGHKIQA